MCAGDICTMPCFPSLQMSLNCSLRGSAHCWFIGHSLLIFYLSLLVCSQIVFLPYRPAPACQLQRQRKGGSGSRLLGDDVSGTQDYALMQSLATRRGLQRQLVRKAPPKPDDKPHQLQCAREAGTPNPNQQSNQPAHPTIQLPIPKQPAHPTKPTQHNRLSKYAPHQSTAHPPIQL